MVYTCIKEHGLITNWGLKWHIILSTNNNSCCISLVLCNRWPHWTARTRVIFHREGLEGAQTLSFTSYMSKHPPWQKAIVLLYTYSHTHSSTHCILTMLAGNKILVPLVIMCKSCWRPGHNWTHTYTLICIAHTFSGLSICCFIVNKCSTLVLQVSACMQSSTKYKTHKEN